MEDLGLPRRYRTIFLAGPTFNLLPDDETASAALRRIRAHLADGGVAVVPLFIETGARSSNRPWILHWFTQQGFRDLATAAGLTTEIAPGGSPDEFTVLLRETDPRPAAGEPRSGSPR
jgi:hypothetical protein